MSQMEANSPTSLSTMLGAGKQFKVNENSYTVCPILSAHIDEFMNEGFNFKIQFFNLFDVESRKKVDKWLGQEIIAIIRGQEVKARYCFDKNQNPMTLEQAMLDGWNVDHFRSYFELLCGISG